MKVFVAHSFEDRDLVAAVANHLRSDGHTIFRPDDLAIAGDVLAEISAALRSADVVIAIVTHSNPNIFYELGLAAGAGVPILLALRPGELIPADLARIPFVQLTDDASRDAQAISRKIDDLRGPSSRKAVDFYSAEATLRAAIENASVLEALPPRDFERLVAKLFEERGYEVEPTPPTHDAGVDLIVRAPEDDQVLFVEVKKLSKQSRVSVDAVRKLLESVAFASGAMGILVSSSGFTAAAIALAATAPIVLRTLEELLAARSKRELLDSQCGGR